MVPVGEQGLRINSEESPGLAKCPCPRPVGLGQVQLGHAEKQELLCCHLRALRVLIGHACPLRLLLRRQPRPRRVLVPAAERLGQVQRPVHRQQQLLRRHLRPLRAALCFLAVLFVVLLLLLLYKVLWLAVLRRPYPRRQLLRQAKGVLPCPECPASPGTLCSWSADCLSPSLQAWGKCSEGWMASNKYCQKTCGAC